MGDNSMYWAGDQSGWYQHQAPPPAPQQLGAHPPHPYQQTPHNAYPPTSGQVAIDQTQQTPPLQIQQVPQQQQQQQLPQIPHQQHPSPHSHLHPPPHSLSHPHTSSQAHPHPHPQPHPQPHQHQHQHHQPQPHPQPHSHQQVTAPQMHHQMMPNGMSNRSHSMQSPVPCPPQSASNQPGAPINHYSPHMSTLHQETSVSAPVMQQQQQHHDISAYQSHPQPYGQHQPPTQHGPIYAQQGPYPSMIPAQGTPNPRHPNMQPQPPQHSHLTHSQQQSQQHQAHYPQQQYSPPTYWNSAPNVHNQHSYGQTHVQQGPPQAVLTPPASIPPDNLSYHNNAAQHQQQPPPPANMPYDSRGQSNMSANYNAPHQAHPNSGYYSPHDVQQQQPPPANPALVNSYDVSHQQPSGAPNNWTNGYYQSNNSPYPPSVMNTYPPPPVSYNGTNAPVSNQPSNPAPNQGHGQQQIQHPHYPHHPHQSQPSQQWSTQNQAKPIIERNKVAEKKPVKPRGPRKHSNPNAPTGRRKRPFMTEEHKQSGYAKFYQIKRKELNVNDFSEASKLISDLWNRLSDDEKSTYAQDVSNKRKEMLKKKASQQAQNLLVQGITLEQEVTLPEK